MADGYVKGHINKVIKRQVCPCTTIAQIVPVYAPNSDHNDEQKYIEAVVHLVAQWHTGKV